VRHSSLTGKQPAVRGRASFFAATCAALFIAVVAGPDAASGASQSFVPGSGTGHFAETGGPFSLNVNGRGEGSLAQGRASGTGVYVDYFEVSGPITCMRVEGNRASVKYRFTRAAGPGAPPQGGGVQVYIEDNGKAKGGRSVDRVASEPPELPGVFDAAAGVCTDPRLNPAWTPLESGDFNVFDVG
jgi:hypothetical protein